MKRSSAIIKGIFGALFQNEHYNIFYIIIFASGSFLGLSSIGVVSPLIAILLVLAALLASFVAFIIIIFRFVGSLRFGDYHDALFQGTAPFVGVAVTYAGYICARYSMLIYAAAQLHLALLASQNGFQTISKNAEIVSLSPDIAVYSLGYMTGGFGVAGDSFYLVLDDTGRYAALARMGRARELVGTPETVQRQHQGFCSSMTVKAKFGSYYLTSANCPT